LTQKCSSLHVASIHLINILQLVVTNVFQTVIGDSVVP
jgi:hypothetical protein